MKLVDFSERHAAGKRLAVLVLELELESLPGALQKLSGLEVPEQLTAGLERLVLEASMHRDVMDAERSAELARLQPPQEPADLPPPPAAKPKAK